MALLLVTSSCSQSEVFGDDGGVKSVMPTGLMLPDGWLPNRLGVGMGS